MFFRAVATLFSLAILLGSSLVQAAPSLHQRQIGNLECNVDRIQIVSDLFSAASTARKLTTELASDSTASGLMTTVSQGILDAQDGVGQIAIALLQGQKAPAASRDQVINGLTSARSALGQISTSDATATKDLGTLTRQVASASAAGAGVIANCV